MMSFKKITLKPLLVILYTTLCFKVVQAQVRLPQLVSNNMVLQRNTALNIWGWAQPGEKLTIKFAGKTYKTVTGNNGKWNIQLAALKAGGPYTMDVQASNHIVLTNILIGDVWFCSGQSNMVLPMERVKEKYPDEIAQANYPQIRNFFIPTVSDVTHEHDDLPPGQWMPATPQNVLGFGAASWFFAKKLYQKYHVPVGIINSSVGGTPIQAWISADAIKQVPVYGARVSQFTDTALLVSMMAVKPRPDPNPVTARTDAGLNGSMPWYSVDYEAKDWHNYWLPGYWAHQGVKGLNGVVWFRKEVNVPAAMTGKAAKLFLGRIIDADEAYVNGKQVGRTTYQYPPRRYNLPDELLKPGKNIIVVRVINNFGLGGFVPDKPYYLAAGTDTIDLRGQWQYKVGQVFKPAFGRGPEVFSAQNEPTGLYNTMVAPAINYKVKGLVWYQGESNAGKPQEYALLLKTLIADWRSKWKNSQLPFIYAQLPNFMEVQYLPGESQWAELREAQLKALSVPNTGMAVTIDAGEWNDIHPLNKKDVGQRLALVAEKMAYGDEKVVSSGPLYQSAKVEGNKIIITFSNTGSGLVAKGGGSLQYFAISGADKKFVWANAVIDGDKVIVSSPEVPDPLYVRYAWADNPEQANLYNREGLPASPFRTDK